VNHLKVSTRLMMLIAVLSTLLCAIGGLGLFGIGQANDALRSVYEDRTVPAAQLGEIRSLVLRNRLYLNIALVTPSPEIIKDRIAKTEANMAEINKTWAAYTATYLTPDEKKLAAAFTADRTKLMQEGLLPALAALRAQDMKEAQRLLTENVRALSPAVEDGADALIKLQIDEARQSYTRAAERYATIRLVSIVSIASGVLFAVLFGFVLVRSIGRQLGAEPDQAAEVARSVATGDLSVPISLRPGDTTSLMAQLRDMQSSLTQVVGSVRQNSESVATASAQIAQGNLDLSQRTEEQASALQQTAASMEQLSSTVKANADNATQANQLARGASTVAVQGGQIVSQVVETMKGINDSSKKIADIISVIDGIAFQTNILALNAAVEAARAGEQGRGFAVVASEVRNLAGRSAEAAKEIKSLITASVERVEQGTALVDRAGITMTEVVSSIKRVTDIMGEISAASTEQSAGVSQVGEAVSQMDMVTQQNAALVEESAAAAESLKLQALQLVQTVAVFKLAQGALVRHAGHDAGSVPEVKVAAARNPIERRGPDRAKNVTRPAFGKAKPAVANTAARTPSEPAPAARTGTNDWESF
jgi:methyl-accepting chemotaxis protein